MGNTLKSTKSTPIELDEHQTVNDGSDRDTKEIVKNYTKLYEQKELANLEEVLENNPDIFILNQLLMSFAFFKDYNREILEERSSTEWIRQVNYELSRSNEKYCLTPDILSEVVNRKVYISINENESKPLLPQRIFVIHDCIEVINPFEPEHYSRIGNISYKVTLKPSSDHTGYVYLPLNITKESIEESRRSSSLTSLSEEKTIVDVHQPSTSTSTDYAYNTTFYKENTPTYLTITEEDPYLPTVRLPHKCFTVVREQFKINAETSSDSSDSENDDISTDDTLNDSDRNRVVNRICTRKYLNSTEFLSHFKNDVFYNSVGKLLYFTNDELNKAKYASGKIFCNTLNGEGNLQEYEIVPAISIQWPNEIAYEWRCRARPEIKDKFFSCKWPTDAMMEKVVQFSCVLTPNGFSPKRGENKFKPIEWEIQFPSAEAYLETQLSDIQMKCYLFVLALYKIFIEPVTQKYGLLVEHIRNHMFWECEENYREWPAHKLGNKIILILNNLKECLSKIALPNYFLRSKNMFENIPSKYLRANQDVLHKILSNPTVCFMVVIKNMTYTSGFHYPKVDIRSLYTYMTTEGIQLINPALFATGQQLKKSKKKNSKRRSKQPSYMSRITANILWDGSNIKQDKLTCNEYINLDIKVKQNMDAIAKSYILKLFIETLLSITRSLNNKLQRIFYLKQAEQLNVLLTRFGVCELDIEQFKSVIAIEKTNCKKMSTINEEGPSAPKRNLPFAFPSKRLVGNIEIDIEKIHRNYTMATTSRLNATSTSKHDNARLNVQGTRNLLGLKLSDKSIVSHDLNRIEIVSGESTGN